MNGLSGSTALAIRTKADSIKFVANNLLVYCGHPEEVWCRGATDFARDTAFVEIGT